MKKLAGIFAALVLAFPVLANQPQPSEAPAESGVQTEEQGVIKQKQTYEETTTEEKEAEKK